ncbi:DUF642 domain-containing protein [Pseudoalteromonas 'SMAR']|uniref:DUF642 domain-containing protein n=1 Tax=Pseudoalteromonas 'SMAR' TaxID=3416908 RepID=UPI003AF21A5F
MIKKLLVVGILCACGASNAAENLVTNGSFESTAAISGNWGLLDSLPGWSNDGAKFEVQKASLGIITPEQGEQYLELDSTRNYSASQTIKTTVGKKYHISFYYSARVEDNNNTNRATVSFAGQQLATLNAISRGWTHYQFTVTATKEQSELRFSGAGKSDSYGAFIDNVVVTEQQDDSTTTPGTEDPQTCAAGLYGISSYNTSAYAFNVSEQTYSFVKGIENTASNIAAHDGALYFLEQLDKSSKQSTLWRVSLAYDEQTAVANTVSWPIYRSTVTPDGSKLLASSKTYLYEFDMQTAKKTVLGKLKYSGDDFSHGDIAYSADTNLIYVLTGKALYSLDKGNMELDLIGQHGVNWASGLAVATDGTLYVSGRNPNENAKIYSLNPNTGAATFIMEGPKHINDLTFVSDSDCNN